MSQVVLKSDMKVSTKPKILLLLFSALFKMAIVISTALVFVRFSLSASLFCIELGFVLSDRNEPEW